MSAYFLFFQNNVSQTLVLCAFFGFILGTYLLSPDLDLRHSKPTKNWGLLRFIWIGYHKCFKHRGKSHSYLLSSFTKIVYLSILLSISLIIVIFLLKYRFEHNVFEATQETQKHLRELLMLVISIGIQKKDILFSIVIGLALSDWIHIFSDQIGSTLKK